MLTRDNLFAYQRRAIDFIKAKPFCALWVDLGLGKTVSALTAFSDLLHDFDARRMLVVAPLRVARKVWTDEVSNWAHLQGLTTSRIIGTSPAERMKGLRTPADIHLINRENLPWLEAQFIQHKKQVKRWPWDVVVLDESHAFMSQSSQRHASMNRLRQPNLNRPIERLIQLTASPMPREYESVWGQIRLLDGGARLGATEEAYIDRWFNRVRHDTHTEYHIRDHAPAEIQALIADLVLVLREEDYFDLPPVQNNYIRVEMSSAAYAKYKELEREALADIKGRTVTAVNEGVLWGKLLQLANGAVYYDDKRNWLRFHDEKINALQETLESISGPSLIAYGFKHDKARIAEALNKFCGNKRVWRALETDADEEAWNRGEVDYLLLHPGSGGEGTNLHKNSCQDIIWFGLTPNRVYYEQLNGRLFGGQRRVGKNGKIHHIVTDGTKDDDALRILTRRGATQTDMKNALAALTRAA